MYQISIDIDYSYSMMHLNVQSIEELYKPYFSRSVLIMMMTLFYNSVYCTAWLLSYAIIIIIMIHINILKKIIAAFDLSVTKL